MSNQEHQAYQSMISQSVVPSPLNEHPPTRAAVQYANREVAQKMRDDWVSEGAQYPMHGASEPSIELAPAAKPLIVSDNRAQRVAQPASPIDINRPMRPSDAELLRLNEKKPINPIAQKALQQMQRLIRTGEVVIRSKGDQAGEIKEQRPKAVEQYVFTTEQLAARALQSGKTGGDYGLAA